MASGTVTVKFLRHLTAVVLVVAAIVGLGLLWAHASGGSIGIGIGGGLRGAPSAKAMMRLQQIKANVIRVSPGTGFHLGNTSNLIRTGEIEAALAALVITVSAIRRRYLRMRRAAAGRA